MSPFEQNNEAQRQLTSEELAQMKAAEADLASDLKQVGDESKGRSSGITASLLETIEATERKGFVRSMVESELSRELFAQDARLARVFAVSGAFSDIKGTTPAQAIALAMTKIRLGRSWGLNEADAMQFIYFNNGRPAVMNELIAAKLQEAGWDWDIRWHVEGNKCVGCTLFPRRQTRAQYDGRLDEQGYLLEVDPHDSSKVRRVEVSFTKREADAAMIWERGKQIPLSSKWNFQSWAQDMYYWRCIGRFKKRYATSILRGAVTQEEAEDASRPEENGTGAQRIIAATPPPDSDPRWLQTGSAKAAAAVADEKIAGFKTNGATAPDSEPYDMDRVPDDRRPVEMPKPAAPTMPVIYKAFPENPPLDVPFIVDGRTYQYSPEAGKCLETTAPASTPAAVTESASGAAASRIKPVFGRRQ